MAQLSVHDAVLSEDKISVNKVCETIAKLLSAVDKADKKACLAAAEGALGALSKLSGREGFAGLTPPYLRTNIKLVLNAAFDAIKAHDAPIGDEIAKFQGFLGSDLDHAVQKLGARECDAKVMKVFDPKEPEERKRKYAALKHSDDPGMNKILDDTIITELRVVSTKLDKLDALAYKLDETNRLLKQIADAQASSAARGAALASIAPPASPPDS